jgi:hypothetical protein
VYAREPGAVPPEGAREARQPAAGARPLRRATPTVTARSDEPPSMSGQAMTREGDAAKRSDQAANGTRPRAAAERSEPERAPDVVVQIDRIDVKAPPPPPRPQRLPKQPRLSLADYLARQRLPRP